MGIQFAPMPEDAADDAEKQNQQVPVGAVMSLQSVASDAPAVVRLKSATGSSSLELFYGKRQPTINEFKELQKTLLTLHKANLIPLLFIVFFGVFRNFYQCADSLVAIDEYDPNHASYDPGREKLDDALRKGTPSPAWYAVFEIVLVMSAATFAFMFLAFLMSDTLPSPRVCMPAAYLFHVPVQVASALYFLGKENLGTMRMARIALMFLFVFGVISSNIRAKKDLDLSKPEDRLKAKRLVQLSGLFIQMALLWIGGFYLAHTFATEWFFTLQKKLKTTFPDQDTKLSHMIPAVAAEAASISMFFNVALPLWQKLYGKRCRTLMMLKALVVGRKLSTLYQERFMFYTNYLSDAVRFTYNRGVMFKVSRFWLFILMVLKDLSYQFWHFGFKYVESIVAFTVKAAHPECYRSMSSNYKRLIKFMELWVRALGIPKSLATSWIHEVDFRRTVTGAKSEQAKKLPKTDICCGIAFCNIKLVIKNLPTDFELDAMPEEVTILKQEQIRRRSMCALAQGFPIEELPEEDYSYGESSDEDDSSSSENEEEVCAVKPQYSVDASNKDASVAVAKAASTGSEGPTAGFGSQSVRLSQRLGKGLSRGLSASLNGAYLRPDEVKKAASILKKIENQATFANAVDVAENCLYAPSCENSETVAAQPTEKVGVQFKQSDKLVSCEPTQASMVAATTTMVAEENAAWDSVSNRSGKSNVSSNHSRAVVAPALSTMSRASRRSSVTRFTPNFPSLGQATALAKGLTAVSLPVSQDDILLIEGVTDTFQMHVFIRYQVRIAVKLFTALNFLAVPMVASNFPTQFQPGFMSPFDGSEAGRHLLYAGFIFLASDLLEFLIITRTILLRQSRNPKQKLQHFRNILSNNLVLYGCATMTFYCGLFQYHATWDPFSPKAWLQHFERNPYWKLDEEDILPGGTAADAVSLISQRLFDICAGRPTSNCVCDAVKESCRGAQWCL